MPTNYYGLRHRVLGLGRGTDRPDRAADRLHRWRLRGQHPDRCASRHVPQRRDRALPVPGPCERRTEALPLHTPTALVLNFNSRSTGRLGPAPIVDLRVYNLMVIDPTGHYSAGRLHQPEPRHDPQRRQAESRVERLLSVSTPASPRTLVVRSRLPNGFTVGTTVCKTFDVDGTRSAASRKANPCSIGYAGRERWTRRPPSSTTWRTAGTPPAGRSADRHDHPGPARYVGEPERSTR